MDNDLSEIDKLTERVTRDPKSKLFVPLAEEYKKIGDIEMSILVLTEGLKNNPGYITAKSFLGRLLLEKGDFAAAQKEFGEVVKAIPDNLLAQRKLGDIYALQGNSVQALEQYKIALTLNPKDEDIASLISDLEAGRPVKGRLEKQHAQHVSDQTGKQKPVSSPHPPGGAPPIKAPASQPAPAHSPSPKAGGREEAEEVHIVEPLEPVAPSGGPGGFDFLNEAAEPPRQAPEEGMAGLFEPTAHAAPAASAPAPAQPPALERLQELPGAAQPSQPASTQDDFTTNTLAELYVAQGFYEKAIDIYVRMLAEKPESKALQDKLTKVRALAGQPALGDKKTADLDSGAALREQVPSGVSGSGGVFERQITEEFVPPIPQGAGGGAVATPEFQPRAYQPPPVDIAKPEAPSEAKAGPVPTESGKKETVDRLEQWLKNVMKEKQR